MEIKKNLLLLLPTLLSALPLFAETITFSSGKTVEGVVVEQTDSSVIVDIAGVPVKYYRDELAGKYAVSDANLKKDERVYRVSKKFYLKARSDAHFLQFCMLLPRKEALHQVISDIEVFPKANTFIKDSTGEEFPIFYCSFLKAGREIVAGVNYRVTFVGQLFPVNPASISDEYGSGDQAIVERYLSNEGNFAMDGVTIQTEAKKITTGFTNPYTKAQAIYNFITRSVEYDDERAARIIGNGTYKTQMPTETLARQRGICYDIAKLYVALTRSVGVPARVVRGIASPEDADVKKYATTVGHAWAEIYLPKYGWVMVDPTFGIGMKKEYFCFRDTSHIAEEYGLAEAKEFGSVDRGWALQVRSKTALVSFPVVVDEEIVVERLDG